VTLAREKDRARLERLLIKAGRTRRTRFRHSLGHRRRQDPGREARRTLSPLPHSRCLQSPVRAQGTRGGEPDRHDAALQRRGAAEGRTG
jgi:hypothetical protein